MIGSKHEWISSKRFFFIMEKETWLIECWKVEGELMRLRGECLSTTTVAHRCPTSSRTFSQKATLPGFNYVDRRQCDQQNKTTFSRDRERERERFFAIIYDYLEVSFGDIWDCMGFFQHPSAVCYRFFIVILEEIFSSCGTFFQDFFCLSVDNFRSFLPISKNVYIHIISF